MFTIEMATATDERLTGSNAALIATNAGLLRQALSLLEQIDQSTFASSPKQVASHRVGSHLRHVLDFYECFLKGVGSSVIDYDARTREALVETDRIAAAEKIRSIIFRMEGNPLLRRDSALFVRMENAGAGKYLRSSVGRELEALSSHTIHHFALIAVTLKFHGIEVDPGFGMSPSTLRYQAAQARALSPEAA